MKTLLPLAALALMGSVGLASAENAFSLPQAQPRNNLVELGTVTLDKAGLVQIYDFNTDKLGALLGSKDLMAGGNEHVQVPIETIPNTQALAVLVVDGKIVAAEPLEFQKP